MLMCLYLMVRYSIPSVARNRIFTQKQASEPIDQRDLPSAIKRSANVSMPDINDGSAAQLNKGSANQPLSEEVAEEVGNLMGELDELLDGTGQ